MRIKKLLAFLFCLSLLPLNALPVAQADDSDIFGANIQPNVMILLDSSGSMATDQVPAQLYDPGTAYPPAVQSGTTYYNAVQVYKDPSSSNKWGNYANTVALVSCGTGAQTTAIQNTLNTGGTWTGNTCGGTSHTLATGNYVNYSKSAAGALDYKINIARRVLTKLINGTDGVRMGLAIYKNNTSNSTNDGAAILAPIGSTQATMVAALTGWTPANYTPLGEALRDIGTYYKHQAVWSYNISAGTYTKTTFADPIQYDCQPNFVIIMTDGLQNGSLDVRTEATNRQTQDHSSAIPGIQKVIVDTVGFAIGTADTTAGANATLQTAATNGGGTFYSTVNESQLEAALEAAIRSIMAASFSFATPTIPTTSATGIARAYLASFESNPSQPLWTGHLKAYNRGADGNVVTDTTTGKPDETTTCFADPPTNSKPCYVWDAGLNHTDPSNKGAMPDSANRVIYTATAINGSRENFTLANTNITATRLGVASTARDSLINFIRGLDAYDQNGDGSTTDERASKLGDIYHSSPVVVTPPFLPGDSSYLTWSATDAIKNRTTILLAGANDGMLHAFRESDGVELWAFIPPDLLDNLKDLSQSVPHEFFVDSSPIAADIKVNGSWKTIVVFGERRGGPYYHALDITDPTNPIYLWSFTDSKIAETWSEPAIGKVKMNCGSGCTEKYVLFVGGGYDTASNNSLGKAVFAVDANTGAKLWEYYYATGATDDRKYMNFSVPGNPLALDLSNDGYIDRLYIGDVGGQIWRFDLNPNPTATDGTAGVAHLTAGMVDNWTGRRFFRPVLDTATADPNPPAAGEYYPTQAIYSPPNAALDTSGNLWLYFGTGDRNHPNIATTTNRFYGMKDTGQTTTLHETDLVAASTITATTTITNGWYVVLPASEKVLSAADVFNSVAFFSTFTPSTTVACGTGGGTAKLYAVQMTNAYAAIDWGTSLPYTTASPSDATKARAKTIGTGIPSKPVVIISDTGATVTTSVIAATTSQQLPSNPAPPPTSMRNILYWKENFQ
jgi:type IV pilus assembly protein PilY1